MSKIKNGGLDQYGAGPLEQQQFGTAGVEEDKVMQEAVINDHPDTPTGRCRLVLGPDFRNFLKYS